MRIGVSRRVSAAVCARFSAGPLPSAHPQRAFQSHSLRRDAQSPTSQVKKRRVKRATLPATPSSAPAVAPSSQSAQANDGIRSLLSSLAQRHTAATSSGAAARPATSASSPSSPSRWVHPADASTPGSTTRPSPTVSAKRREHKSTEHASRSPRARLGIEGLPGGHLQHAIVPSPLTLLQADRVCADVQRFLTHNGGAMQVLRVPHTTLKRAVVEFTPAPGCASVTAIGQSTKEKIARKLCLLHAASLIDHFSIHAAATVTSGAGDHTSVLSSASALPPPLVSEPVRATGKSTSGSSSASHPLSTPFAAAVPTPARYVDWEAYVRAASSFVASRQEEARLASLQRGEVPLSGNPFVDHATVRLAQRTRPLPKLLLQRLNSEIRDASRNMTVTPLGREWFVASLPLDARSGLVATGVARSSRAAKQRCAGHAIYILQELQKIHHTASSSDTHGGSPHRGHGDEEVTHSAPLPSLVDSLKPRQSRLFAFFQHLYLSSSTAQTVAFESRFHKGKHGRFVCTVRLDDVSCEATGLNRFEAERSAVAAALAELELHDPRVQQIGSFIDRYPRADAQALVRAALPGSLRERMKFELQRYEAVLGTQTEPSPPTTPSDKETRESILPPTIAGAHASEVSHALGGEGILDTPADCSGPTALGTPPRNLSYAAYLREQLCRLRADPRYVSLFHTRRTTLAMVTVRDTLLHALETNRVVLVCGTTGCGKTTQVPQYILDDAIIRGEGDQCRILVTQPRRLTTFGVADRIAQERLEEVGQNVGYAVRLDAKPGRHITLCTSGVLLQMLVSSPSLTQYSHLILDEVHERDLNCDVTLALVKTLLRTNPRLKVILMSATMQHDLFVDYFRSWDATQPPEGTRVGHDACTAPPNSEDNKESGHIPVIHVEGQVYPVTEVFLEDIAEACRGGSDAPTGPLASALTPFSSRMFDRIKEDAAYQPKDRLRTRGVRPPPATDYKLIAHLVHRSVQCDMHGDPTGKSILVFLPGWKELLSAQRAIEEYPAAAANARPHIILLHSTVDSAKQKECFLPSPPGTVKVVLATNIAESGITIDDVAVVIDSGLLKLTTWTAVRGGHRSPSDSFSLAASPSATSAASFGTQLSLGYASKANCTQRKGRAGRTQGGICYRLFTRATYDAMETFQAAEIHRVSLAQVLLKLLSLGHINPRETLKQFIEAPSTKNVEVSMTLLKSLGAVDRAESLTALGHYLAHLPCDPRVGKMIVMGAVLRCLDSVLTVAATSDASPFVNSRLVAAEVRQQRFLFASGSQSDHVSALNAYNACCQQAQRHGGISAEVHDFAAAHYVSISNVRLISRYKLQYRDILAQAGLLASATAAATEEQKEGIAGCANTESDEVASSGHARAPRRGELFIDESPLSDYAGDVALVKACVAAALFPNVAVLDRFADKSADGRGDRGRKKLSTTGSKLALRTKAHPLISPSKESVCRRAGAPREHGLPSREELVTGLLPAPSQPGVDEDGDGGDGTSATTVASPPAMFYVYQDIFSVQEARKDFLTNVTAISLWALFLFGAGEANVSYDTQVRICVIDDWVFVSMSPDDYAVLQQLKRLLFAAVWRLYERPHDREGLAALRGLRALSYAVLTAPLQADPSAASGTTEDKNALRPRDRSQCSLVDSGAIVRPLESTAGPHDPTAHAEVTSPLTGTAAPQNAVEGGQDDDDDDDVFGVFMDEED